MAVILKKIIAGREIPLPDLLKLWKRSVRASHFFLAEQDILRLRPIVQEALTGIPELLGIFVDTSFIGFAGIQEDKYATEGAAECLHYAFQTLQAPEVIADIRMENKASIRVAERIGMTPTGQYDKIVYGKIMPHLLYRIRQ